ncbi:carboxy-lyase [Malassezia pachydermatis]
MRDYHEHILPGITQWQHPMFFGYFPSNVTYEGILADMFAAMTTNPAFNWNASPAVTELEFIALNWIASMLGLSEAFHTRDEKSTSGGGVILGSASESTLIMAIAARERAVRHRVLETGRSDADVRADLLPKMVLYCTTQTHSSGHKAAKILGLQCRSLPVYREDHFGLRGETLRAALEEDLRNGRYPFYLVASYGTTNTCAIDYMPELVDVRTAYPQLWLHLDAAYAGVVWSLPEYRDVNLEAVNKNFDSLSTNLHKWGLVQFESSPTFVRDRTNLTEALSLTPEYLKSKNTGHDSVWDLRNMQITLGRRFRALKVWMVLRSYGIEGFQAHLRKCMRLAKQIHEGLASHARLEMLAPPRWGLVLFRLTKPEATTAELDALNHAFDEVLSHHSAEILLTPTTLPTIGFCFRLVVGAPATTDVHAQRAIALLTSCADATLAHASATC